MEMGEEVAVWEEATGGIVYQRLAPGAWGGPGQSWTLLLALGISRFCRQRLRPTRQLTQQLTHPRHLPSSSLISRLYSLCSQLLTLFIHLG